MLLCYKQGVQVILLRTKTTFEKFILIKFFYRIMVRNR